MCLLDIHMGQHMTATAHLIELKAVQQFTLGCFSFVPFGEISHVIDAHALVAFQLPNFLLIVAILVRKDFSAGEAFHGDNHRYAISMTDLV